MMQTQAAQTQTGQPADFLASQTNAALRHQDDVRLALEALRDADLPLHPDPPKNWDSYLALCHALETTGPDDVVLDAGAESYSTFLPGLRQLGWRNLLGINLAFAQTQDRDGIRYRPGDVTATGLPAASLSFIACLSVIEHGVDPARFFAEQARLLRPGGHLFLSFDYWEDPVETFGQHAYGVPIRIFSRDDVAALLAIAAAHGLAPRTPFRPSCAEKVVHWQRFGLRYSFANLLLGL